MIKEANINPAPCKCHTVIRVRRVTKESAIVYSRMSTEPPSMPKSTATPATMVPTKEVGGGRKPAAEPFLEPLPEDELELVGAPRSKVPLEEATAVEAPPLKKGLLWTMA